MARSLSGHEVVRRTLVRPLWILVVDDLETNRVALAAMLRRLGHEVEVASSGRSATQLASLIAFDVLFLDWK